MNGRKRMSTRRFRAITLANFRQLDDAKPKLVLEDGQVQEAESAKTSKPERSGKREPDEHYNAPPATGCSCWIPIWSQPSPSQSPTTGRPPAPPNS